MIKDWEYHTGEKKGKRKSELSVRFRFGQETAPQDKRIILARMDYCSPSEGENLQNLYDYITKRMGTPIQNKNNKTIFGNNLPSTHRVTVSELACERLGFDIEVVRGESRVPIDELLDMVELDTFIITGNLPS